MLKLIKKPYCGTWYQTGGFESRCSQNLSTRGEDEEGRGGYVLGNTWIVVLWGRVIAVKGVGSGLWSW